MSRGSTCSQDFGDEKTNRVIRRGLLFARVVWTAKLKAFGYTLDEVEDIVLTKSFPLSLDGCGDCNKCTLKNSCKRRGSYSLMGNNL